MVITDVRPSRGPLPAESRRPKLGVRTSARKVPQRGAVEAYSRPVHTVVTTRHAFMTRTTRPQPPSNRTAGAVMLRLLSGEAPNWANPYGPTFRAAVPLTISDDEPGT